MDILQDIWPLLLYALKAIKDKEDLRHCYSCEKQKKTWQLNVGTRWDPGAEEALRIERNLNQVWTLVNHDASVLVYYFW